MCEILRHGLRKGWMLHVMGNLGEGAVWIPLTSSCVGRFSKLWTLVKSCLPNPVFEEERDGCDASLEC
jgi:hypothetical protein